MNHDLIPHIIQNLHYFVVEYDYKFCNYRSLHLHEINTGSECDCHQNQIGKIISTFFVGAEHVFYMSQKQRDIYIDRFPFLEQNGSVLSSVFDVKDLEYIEGLRKTREVHNEKWAVVDGKSWIKGLSDIEDLLQRMNEEYEILSGLSYSDLLRKLSEFKGLAARPKGHDTCPRLVIEAKLLGLELMINENVQHASEDWFNSDLDAIEMYLLQRHEIFWNKISNHVEKLPSLSGYTQAYNVMSTDYPWRESIYSMLGFCDEVVVLDGGSDDGTYEELQKLAADEPRLIVKQLKRDWNGKRFALHDGQQKAAARTLCTKEWCWQQDIDEIVHEQDYEKIKKIAGQMPKAVSLICLPVIDYWGHEGKVRVDATPWKWRLSRNDTHITHGVPNEQRRYDEEGDLFSAGSDGCDYVHNDNYYPIPHVNFFTPDHEQVRSRVLNDLDFRKENLKNYERFMNTVVEELPSVHHYSWFNIVRKIHTYKNYWSRHWSSLFNKDIQDTVENNMFFEKKWSEVSDEEIVNLAKRMNNELGGWIFHNRIDFAKPTPWLNIKKSHPSIMRNWLEKHGEIK